MGNMYLKGSQWSLRRRRRRRRPLLIVILVILILAFSYLNFFVVPYTPPLFIPTPTPTRAPESYITEAEQAFQEGRLAAAIEAYQQAILVDPSNRANYVALARVQVWAGQYEEALKNAELALLGNENYALGHAVRAWVLNFMGRSPDAEGEILQALDAEPDNPLFLAYQAEILMDKGDFGELETAIDASRRAVELGPTLFEAHRNIGRAHRALGDYNAAISAFQRADALNPLDDIPDTEMARTYAQQGQFGSAINAAQTALRDAPTNPYRYGNLGLMYYQNNEYDKAIDNLAIAIHGGTTPEGYVVEGIPLDYGFPAQYYYTYGLALARSNRCEEAIPIFRALLTVVSADETAVFNANEGLSICGEIEATPTP